jgi:hypothetical protein
MFDRVQNSATRALETAIAAAVSIFGPLCTAEVVEDSSLGCGRFIVSVRRTSSGTDEILTRIL